MAPSDGHLPEGAAQALGGTTPAAPGRELLLHVGMHKTGTTSIQQTLLAHAALLQKAGYSWFGDTANHSREVFSAFTAHPHRYHLNRQAKLHRPEDAKAYADACRARLLGFLAEAPGPRLIISGESIALLGVAEVRQMLEAFRPLVDRIVVIGFVRPPRSFIGSAIQEQVRGGADREVVAAPQYRRRFAAFLEAPEVADVRLQLYAPHSLLRGCSVATFLQVCGAPPDMADQMEVRRVNGSRSRLGTVLTLAANDAVPVFLPGGAPNPERTPRLVRFLERLEGPKFLPPEAVVAEQLHRSADDIAWMEGVLGTPFPDAEKQPQPPGAATVDDLDSLHGEELRALARGLNSMFREVETRMQRLRTAGGRPVGGAAKRRGPLTTKPKRERQGA